PALLGAHRRWLCFGVRCGRFGKFPLEFAGGGGGGQPRATTSGGEGSQEASVRTSPGELCWPPGELCRPATLPARNSAGPPPCSTARRRATGSRTVSPGRGAQSRAQVEPQVVLPIEVERQM